jgi:hypothetical protein
MEFFVYGILVYFCISIILTIFTMVIANINGKSMGILSIIFLLYSSPILLPIAINNAIKKMRKNDS